MNGTPPLHGGVPFTQWSDEDQLFLVTIPEFADLVLMPCTHGKTREAAIHNAEEIIEMYLEAWQAENQPIPKPKIPRKAVNAGSAVARRSTVHFKLLDIVASTAA